MTARCCACDCSLGTERTTVRRKDGTVRFEMCNACFDHRFCQTCLTYFSSPNECQEHRCAN